MKVIYEHAIGGDGAVIGLYIEGDKLVEKVSYPLAKVLTPVNSLIGIGVDKLEALIPGDQKDLAEKLKAQANEQLVKLLSE
jgi:hypothetical protein